VPQRHPREGLPAVLAGQGGDLRQQRVRADVLGQDEVDAGRLVDVLPGGVGSLDDVQQAEAVADPGGPVGDVLGQALAAQPLHPGAQREALAAR